MMSFSFTITDMGMQARVENFTLTSFITKTFHKKRLPIRCKIWRVASKSLSPIPIVMELRSQSPWMYLPVFTARRERTNHYLVSFCSVVFLLIAMAGCGKGDVIQKSPIESPQDTAEVEVAVPAGMVLIPAGEFLMGSNTSTHDNEKPVHTVYVDAFYINETEVTNAQFKAFLLENPRWCKDRIKRRFHSGDYLYDWNGNNYPAGEANHPVRYVSWYAAMAYSKWAGKRLPTEAEWEYAARGGLVGKTYPHGNTITPQDANYGRNIGHTTAVGRYPANGYGLYDMAGNVWEWCLDKWDSDFYATFPLNGVARNPVSVSNDMVRFLRKIINMEGARVLRGGSWFMSAQGVRVADRDGNTPTRTLPEIGFRCVQSAN